ncbi:MAG: hypothetical protein E4G91_05130 [Candidatus Zixiibacteriota bacterium]|nr:MAG: hypothetical protein E4G91_05130 [candidate division Zixibacteria bacterium]
MRSRVLLALFVMTLMIGQAARAQRETDSLKEEVQTLREKLDGVVENLTTVNSDVGILKHLKVSGYLQARYEYIDTVLSGTAPNSNSNIYIRRGRIKFSFQPGSSSKYVIYFDASKNLVSLKEAYVELYKRIQQHNFALTVGQQNLPFGYEIEYSSSKRDFPERSLAENTLFKGERDRGINLTWGLPKYLRFNLGVFQGAGIDDATFTWFDPTKQKDIIARAKAKLGMVDFGLSSYWGKRTVPGSAAVAGITTWFDANGDSVIQTNEVKATPAKAAVAATGYEKRRYGIDAQAYFDVLPVGGSAVRTEFYYGDDYSSSASDKMASGKGFYFWLSQTLGKKFAAAARYDFWDPNVHGDYTDGSPKKKDDATGTMSLAMHYYWDSWVRVTAAYDMPRLLKDGSLTSKSPYDPKDNRFTLQFQFTI